ncbi:MAG: RNA polymerase sigma factor [Verrucomicrobiaceae bacterium]|nr:RNA polymerase sigma factor [Verrucomicrobiaceae bacterium]
MSDAEFDWSELVQRARCRDAAAERLLVERLYPRIAGLVRTWKARRETVEDLVQEVYLRLFSRLDQYRGGSFPAWVDVITRRVCYDALRKRRVRPEWTFAELGEDAPAEGAAVLDPADVDAAQIVAELLARLPPTQAWLLREVELAERAIGDVAKEMGWTAVGGRLRLFRARQALKKLYHEQNPHE